MIAPRQNAKLGRVRTDEEGKQRHRNKYSLPVEWWKACAMLHDNVIMSEHNGKLDPHLKVPKRLPKHEWKRRAVPPLHHLKKCLLRVILPHYLAA